MSLPVLESLLTCPRCGFVSLETMPTDACRYYHECARCSALLRPKPGDCCVFCTYGSVKCPPIQAQHGCCREEGRVGDIAHIDQQDSGQG